MRRTLVRMTMVAGLLACGIFSGCEDSPNTENANTYFDDSGVDSVTNRPTMTAARMQITPASATVTIDGGVGLFKVEGASGAVSWSVQNASRGKILTQTRQSATYQRSTIGDNVVIVADSAGNAAFAIVSQPDGALAPPASIQITPESTSLTTNGQTALFTVTGASGAVTWSVQDISKGSILTQSDLSATYQRSSAGGNVVVATDSLGNAAFALISQL